VDRVGCVSWRWDHQGNAEERERVRKVRKNQGLGVTYAVLLQETGEDDVAQLCSGGRVEGPSQQTESSSAQLSKCSKGDRLAWCIPFRTLFNPPKKVSSVFRMVESSKPESRDVS